MQNYISARGYGTAIYSGRLIKVPEPVFYVVSTVENDVMSYELKDAFKENQYGMMNLKVSSSANLTSMFEGCSKLRTVYLSKTLKNSTKNTNMFKNCSASKYYY